MLWLLTWSYLQSWSKISNCLRERVVQKFHSFRAKTDKLLHKWDVKQICKSGFLVPPNVLTSILKSHLAIKRGKVTEVSIISLLNMLHSKNTKIIQNVKCYLHKYFDKYSDISSNKFYLWNGAMKYRKKNIDKNKRVQSISSLQKTIFMSLFLWA